MSKFDTNGILPKDQLLHLLVYTKFCGSAKRSCQIRWRDLAFLDVDMPEMSGIDFAIAAKSYTTIIFITVMPGRVQELFKNENFYYLPKPIAYDRFLLCIAMVRSDLRR